MRHTFIRIMTFLCIGLAAASCGCSGQKGEEKKEETKMTFNPDTLPAEPVFDIVTDMGTIRVKLYSQTPLHRDNFVKLASEGFYDGVLFHRVIDGFMIQTGDPLTKDPASMRKALLTPLWMENASLPRALKGLYARTSAFFRYPIPSAKKSTRKTAQLR